LLRCKYSTWSPLGTKVILNQKEERKGEGGGYFENQAYEKYYKSLSQILVKSFSHLSRKP